MSSNSSSNSSSSSSSSSSSTPSPKRRHVEDVEEDMRSLILFLLGAVGYECEADRVARVSKRILESEQIVEGISRHQFPPTMRNRLMYAASVGNLQRLDFIAGLGARVNMTARDESKYEKATALHIASENGHAECVRSLCDRGAMIDAQDEGGHTALYNASYKGHLDIVRILCERGAQIDLLNSCEWTALDIAVYYNKIDVTRFLCERGANTLRSGYGRTGTAYAWACSEHGVDSPIALLLKSYPH